MKSQLKSKKWLFVNENQKKSEVNQSFFSVNVDLVKTNHKNGISIAGYMKTSQSQLKSGKVNGT